MKKYRAFQKWPQNYCTCLSLQSGANFPEIAIVYGSPGIYFLSELMEANGFQSIYLGYNDRLNEGDWVWSDGKSTCYTNWKVSEGQPDNYRRKQDCGSMSVTSRWNGTWDDYWCRRRRTFFCQIDLYVSASFCDNIKSGFGHSFEADTTYVSYIMVLSFSQFCLFVLFSVC